MTQKELLDKFGDFVINPSFKNQLLSNTKETLQKHFPNYSFPEKVSVHQNNHEEMHIVLIPSENLIFNDMVEESVEQVLDKALTDSSFKKLLIADPKGTLTKALPDFYIPSNFKVYFHENTENELHLIIPNIESKSDELSEAELDAVAGGTGGHGPHIGRGRGSAGPKCRSQHFIRR